MASTFDNRTAAGLSINDLRDLRDMFTEFSVTNREPSIFVHPETTRGLFGEPNQILPSDRYGRSVNFNISEVYGPVGGLAPEKIKHKYKGILTMSLEVFLESIGITTNDAEIGGIEFRRDNDTVEIYIRSKEQIIPVGDELQLHLQNVPEGCEVPRINIENIE
jgi:hypothetical protein